MKKYLYYFSVLFCFFIAIFFYKQRGMFLVSLNSESYIVEEATIMAINNRSLLVSNNDVVYEHEGKQCYGKVSYSIGDCVGDKITIYIYKGNKYFQRDGYIKKLDIFSVVIIGILVLMILDLFLAKKIFWGQYRNKLYYISFAYDWLLFTGVYASARGSKIDFLLYILLVWGQAIVVLSYVARRYEFQERNKQLLNKYSISNSKEGDNE